MPTSYRNVSISSISFRVSCFSFQLGFFTLSYQASLPHPEPLVHFSLVNGSRSGPALRSYSPGNIDRELTDAACHFLRSGGFSVDLNAKIVYASKLLRWQVFMHSPGSSLLIFLYWTCSYLKYWILNFRFGSDFGTNEDEVLKFAVNYLKSEESKAFLELLPNTQFKVVYQPFDWGLNN